MISAKVNRKREVELGHQWQPMMAGWILDDPQDWAGDTCPACASSARREHRNRTEQSSHRPPHCPNHMITARLATPCNNHPAPRKPPDRTDRIGQIWPEGTARAWRGRKPSQSGCTRTGRHAMPEGDTPLIIPLGGQTSTAPIRCHREDPR